MDQLKALPTSSPTEKVHSLLGRLSSLSQSTARAEGQVTLLRDQIDAATTGARHAFEAHELLDRVLVTLVELEQEWRRSAERTLTAHASRGLSLVFGEDLRLSVETKTVRDMTSMVLKLKENGVELDDIVESTGGSRVAVLDMLLNLMFLVSVTPKLEQLMVMDEPFGSIEQAHLPALGQLLREIHEQRGVQFIIVSQDSALVDAADVVYEVKDGGVRLIKSREESRG